MTVGSAFRVALVPALVLFVLTLPIFLRLTSGAAGDHRAHLWLAYELQQAGQYPAYPLYDLAIIAASGGNPRSASTQSAVILALAVGIAGGLSAVFLSRKTPAPVWKLCIFCVTLALAMPLPNWWNFPALYDGQVTPNVWDRPTTIFCLPFALGVFMVSLRALTRFTIGSAAGLGVLMAVTALAKPDFLLAFLPCVVVALNWTSEKQDSGTRISSAGQLIRFGLVVVPVVLALTAEALQLDLGRGSVTFALLGVWNESSRYIPVSILVGIAFPLSVSITYWKRLSGEMALLLAWATLIVAILLYSVLSEIRNLQTEGDFASGMYLADHVLFVASCEFLRRQPASRWKWVNWGILGLHAIAGGVYVTRAYMSPGMLDKL